ncbi:MAG: phosphotransferase [Actinobacteria bacterium]|nr:phosphotransferase [Actinomycetota bacterium]
MHRPTGDSPRERATRALRAHAPRLLHTELTQLGQGLDNTAYIAGGLVLRVAHDRDVEREARLLDTLAPHLSIAIPTPRFADAEAGVLAYELIAGRPLLGRLAPAGAGRRLGRFLRELHAIEPATVQDLIQTEDADPSVWLEDRDGPSDLVEIVHASRPQRTRQRVVAHADLGVEHILERGGTLTGIIDWSDAAITDPALDFARVYRDFGPSVLGEAIEAYGALPAAMARIEFFARCAALEDLAFGIKTGRHEYATNAERSFGWLFPQRA